MARLAIPRALVRTVAFCSALVAGSVALPSTAAADEWIPALSLQGGFTAVRSPGNDSNDYFVAATPELSYFFGTGRARVGITYSFTGSLNSFLPNGLANRLALTTAFELSGRTTLLVGAEALQASIGNYLLVRRTAETRLAGVPALNTQLLTLTATQGLAHEISPVVQFTQGVTGTYVRSLDPAIKLNNYLASVTFGIDRSWEFDALGADLVGQYASTDFPRKSQLFTAALGPRWVHDWTPTITTTASVAGAIAFSPDPGTKERVTPAGSASVLLYSEGSGIELSYAGGFEPNLLLGTLLQSHQVTLRGYTPISEQKRILFGVSGGYLRAKTLDLRTTGANDNEFDAILHDVDLTWGATSLLSIFARYQFIGQASGEGPSATPAIVRHAAIIGLTYSGQPDDRGKIPKKFPTRVDRKDAPPPSKRF